MSAPHLENNNHPKESRRTNQASNIRDTAVWSRIQERAARGLVQPRQLFLPGLEPFMRAMPNHIARSSLFAPVARGNKLIYKDEVLISRGDAVITFSGEQLDESQADVWMQAMQEAIRQPLGEPVVINRDAFLKVLGRTTGGNDYKWLLSAMKALTFAMLVIQVHGRDGNLKLSVGKTRALHLIDAFDYDDEIGRYIVRVDPRWQQLYGNHEFACIDWEKRLAIKRGQDMAKTLQRLAATSADKVQRHGLEWLKDKLQYTSRIDKFRNSLRKAMDELERVGIIASGRLEISTRGKEQVVWIKL
ncbi:plasmid replication initiator TrfA [Burkholderia anthina]|uniref:plasmid replication initiator TrfA n=1 Tax=Burkholderia anthina TaxID=179879 RepID=UPI00158E0D31